MELSKCFGCMEDFRGYPCPKCGYDPGKDKRMEYALPPETILAGKYLVGKVLGQGGFGITYIGWDIALERKVAIKEYYPSGQVSRNPGTRTLTWYSSEQSLHARQDGMQMFLKEARKMVRADSIPGVVRVIDLFQENNTAYIAMEFVEGETLKNRLRREGPMDWETAKRIFRPVISAMEQVHAFGLIHRDLSPDNIMLLPDGSVKILDLGAAKDLSINSGASSMQVAKSGFSPLEQYIQRGGSGSWTDVYSMAATIYYTLTGKMLPSAVERLEKDTISWDFPALNRLPAQTREALKKALAVQVKDRTQTMEALEKGLFAEPVKVQPKPVVEKKTPAEPAANSGKPEKPKKKKLWKMVVATALATAVGTNLGHWVGAMTGGAIKEDKTTSGQKIQVTAPAKHRGQDEAETTAEPTELVPYDVQGTTVPDGYISIVDGDWEKVTLSEGYNTWNVHAYVFSQELKRCREMTVAMNVSMKAGTKCKDWQLWGRVGGKFKKLASITLSAGDGYTEQTIRFDTPVTLDAIAITPTVPGGYSWSMGLAVGDVWTDG